MTSPETRNGIMDRRAALGLAGAAGLLALARPARGSEPEARPKAMVAFVLRHAETGGTQNDPSLSPVGRERARRTGLMLRSVGVQRVLHTPTARARETAAEIARAVQAGLGSYEPRDPGPVTARMIEHAGAWVLVGHSNTVPDLVRRLGGDPGLDLIPEAQHDRVFMVVRHAGGVLTVPLHVG